MDSRENNQQQIPQQRSYKKLIFAGCASIAVIGLILLAFHIIVFKKSQITPAVTKNALPTISQSPQEQLAQNCPFIRDHLSIVNSVIPTKGGIIGSIQGTITGVSPRAADYSVSIIVTVNGIHQNFLIETAKYFIIDSQTKKTLNPSELKPNKSIVIDYACMNNTHQFLIKQISVN